MSHRQNVPKAQKRTLRSIAETKGASPAGFDGGLPYVPTTGVPLDVRGSQEVYNDAADSAAFPPTPRGSAPDPQPFGTLKRGG